MNVLEMCIRDSNKPTPMLRDRIKEAVTLYKNKKAPKIIMSGDHSSDEYNEVAVMKSYAIKSGVPSSDIFLDHAGFSTYDSLIPVSYTHLHSCIFTIH